MNLNELRIERQKYGEDKGQVRGTIEFDNEFGKVSIILTPDKCQKIFEVCADGIIDVAKQAAEELTCTVIEHKKAIAND